MWLSILVDHYHSFIIKKRSHVRSVSWNKVSHFRPLTSCCCLLGEIMTYLFILFYFLPLVLFLLFDVAMTHSPLIFLPVGVRVTASMIGSCIEAAVV